MSQRQPFEKYHSACPWHIRVGNLFIAPGFVPNSGKVWIGEVESGEGGEFDAADLEPILRKFYSENY